jgi:hypothetical protein
MAQQQYRANLLSADFPFLSENHGRTVIVGQIDQATHAAANPADRDKTSNAGIPQLYYCHNVVPTQQGLQSVGFETLTTGLDAETSFVDVLPLRDSLDRKAYLGYTSDGRFYITTTPFSTWTLKLTHAPAAGKLVTRAYTQGVTYIYIANVGCYKYDFDTNALVSVTLTGLTAANILGVTSLSGYLVAWTSDAVAWSAIADPTDFVPSLSTGAGGGSVEGAAGALLVMAAANIGILAYTTGNVLSANYTGNSQYPFIFRALPSSGGLKNAHHADYDSLSGQQYAYTTSGLQLCDVQRAQMVLPAVTDFISGGEFEDINSTTGAITKETLSTAMVKQLKMVANRYLIISYGKTSLTHALLLDTQLKRFGKFKINHVSVVDLLLGEETEDVAKNSIGFVQADGSIKVVDYNSQVDATDAVAILGKYQFVRSRKLQLNEIEFENIEADDTFTVRVMTSQDGKNTTLSAALTPIDASTLLRTYPCRITGLNHSLFLTGNFRLNSLLLNFTVHGRR